MKRLRPFAYFEPASLAEAMEILMEGDRKTYPLAGGTDLLVRMKRGDVRPSALVNLKRIQGLDRITVGEGKGLHIGALTTLSDVERSPLIQRNYPVLAQAVGLLGSPSIRNLGLWGET